MSTIYLDSWYDVTFENGGYITAKGAQVKEWILNGCGNRKIKEVKKSIYQSFGGSIFIV